MQRLDVVGTLGGAHFLVPSPDVAILEKDGRIGLVNAASGETVWLSATSLLQMASFSVHGNRTALTVDGLTGGLLPDLVSAAVVAGQNGQSLPAWLGVDPLWTKAVQVVGWAGPAGTILYATRADGSGIYAFSVGADGTLSALATTADTAESHAQGIAQMVVTQVGGQNFLLAASGPENGLSAWAMAADGTLALRSSLSMQPADLAAQILPVQNPTALASTQWGGETLVFLAASDTSSITAVSLSSAGQLRAESQIMDMGDTRFANITALDAITVQDRVFVVAAGRDGGVTLLTLLPDRSLQVLAVQEDLTSTRLADVNSLRLVQQNGQVYVVVTSSSEAGASILRLDLAALGSFGTATDKDDLLTAGAGQSLTAGGGDDLILDSSGVETLFGGGGADTFIFSGDGRNDVIGDFDPLQDRIDLTRWAFFRNEEQLTFRETDTGAVLTFWDESLELVAGRKLTLAEVVAALLPSGGRVMLDPGEARPFVPEPPRPAPPQPPLPQPAPPPQPQPAPPPPTPVVPPPVPNLLQGGPGDDQLFGGKASETLIGGDGQDLLLGGGGQDRAEGGNGDDTLAGGDGADLLFGGNGRDALSGDAGEDELWGEADADTLTGGGAADRLYGGDGDDRLLGGAEDDELNGDDGADTLLGDAAQDRIFGGAGADQLEGGLGHDVLDGGPGNDLLLGGEGQDSLYGGAGADTLRGFNGDDKIWGGAEDDEIVLADGNDIAWGEWGHDRLSGGDGDDTLCGNDGNDFLEGLAGADQLFGDAGNDRLLGGVGLDILFGGDGRDLLNGGPQADRMTGGGGVDYFIFDSHAKGELDIITDFQDRLDQIVMGGVRGRSDSARYKALSIKEIKWFGEKAVQITWAGHRIILEDTVKKQISLADFDFI